MEILPIISIILLIVLGVVLYIYVIKFLPQSIPVGMLGGAFTQPTAQPIVQPMRTQSIQPFRTQPIVQPLRTQPIQPTIQPMRTQSIQPTIQPLRTQPPIVGGNDCLSLINAFRKQQNVPPLVAATAEQIACANKCAANDTVKGFHDSFRSQMCPGDSGQCECSGISSVETCINMYIAEGPGGGHYEILRNPQYKILACGTDGKGFYTHNFYR